MTLRDIASELITDIKGITLDDNTSYRYVISKFESKMKYFIRLEFRSREFAKMQNLWQPIHRIQLQKVEANPCGYIDSCKILMRSENKLPESISTNYGLLLKILTIDGRDTFTILNNSSEYKDYISRRWGKVSKIAYVEDDYLYVVDQEIDAVKALIVTMKQYDLDKCNSKSTTKCTFPLDVKVVYPEYLITLAKKEVLNEISGVYKRMVEDEKGDDNTNIKN